MTEPAASDGEAALWQNLLEAFEEERRHQAFLAYCRETHALDHAARRYRQHAASEDVSAEHRAIAEQKLKAITVLAIAQFSSIPRTDPVAAPKLLRLLAALLLAASVLVLGWALAFR